MGVPKFLGSGRSLLGIAVLEVDSHSLRPFIPPNDGTLTPGTLFSLGSSLGSGAVLSVLGNSAREALGSSTIFFSGVFSIFLGSSFVIFAGVFCASGSGCCFMIFSLTSSFFSGAGAFIVLGLAAGRGVS